MYLKEAVDLIRNGDLEAAKHAARWADLGAGSGLFTRALASLLPASSVVYGVDKKDIPDPMRTTNGVELIFRRFDFEKDGWDMEELDGILMANSLHYVMDKVALVKKMRGYLKKDGVFMIVEYDQNEVISSWVPYPISFAHLVHLFESCGYATIQKLGERPSRYGHRNMYAALVK